MDQHKIRQIEAKIKEDVKNLNDITKLKACLNSSKASIKHAALQSMRRVFLFLADKGRLKAPRQQSKEKEATALEKFRVWLWEHYTTFVKFLSSQLTDEDDNTQILAFRSLMEFVSVEGKLNGNPHAFGTNAFRYCIAGLVSAKASQQLISVFEGEFMAPYSDVQFYTLQNIHSIIAEKRQAKEDAAACAPFVKRALKFLDLADLPQSNSEMTFFVPPAPGSIPTDDTDSESDQDSEAAEEEDECSSRKRKATTSKTPVRKRQRQDAGGAVNWPKKHRKIFSQCWIDVLKLPLTKSLHRTVLLTLPEEVLPCLSQPLLLADFLTDSYNVGGVTSLLALNGLFILIQEHNFDYPEFYTKLYRLIADPTLLEDEHRQQFFVLVELFLSSSHLPAYLVAAFVKRFARVALCADPGAILFIIPFIYNQLLRHKECMQLIHRTGVTTAAERAAERRQKLACATDVEKGARDALKPRTSAENGGPDPFNNQIDTNPEDSNALDSSLWELMSLKSHYYPPVAALVKNIVDTRRTKPFELKEYNQQSYQTLFDQQFNSSAKSVPSEEQLEVTKLFQCPEDQADDIFTRVFAFPVATTAAGDNQQ